MAVFPFNYTFFFGDFNALIHLLQLNGRVNYIVCGQQQQEDEKKNITHVLSQSIDCPYIYSFTPCTAHELHDKFCMR